MLNGTPPFSAQAVPTRLQAWKAYPDLQHAYRQDADLRACNRRCPVFDGAHRVREERLLLSPVPGGGKPCSAASAPA